MKTKGQEWDDFAVDVYGHIRDYAIPQYGDYPDEQVENWTPEMIQDYLYKYVRRINSSQRGREEDIRDTFKIAHYACYLHKKLKGSNNELG